MGQEDLDPNKFWLFKKQRNTYVSCPKEGGKLNLQVGDTFFDLAKNQIIHVDGTPENISGKLGDVCRSFWINVTAQSILLFDLEASSGVTLEANGKQNIIGLPFNKFVIRTTVVTRVSFIASIYPFPISIESIEHFESFQPINYVLGAINNNETVVTFLSPVTCVLLIVGLAPCRLAYDRATLLTDPLIPPGAYSLPLKINQTIQALSPFGLSTFNGWGYY